MCWYVYISVGIYLLVTYVYQYKITFFLVFSLSYFTKSNRNQLYPGKTNYHLYPYQVLHKNLKK